MDTGGYLGHHPAPLGGADKEIRQAAAHDIQRACQTLEATTVKRIDGVRNDVQELKHHISQQERKLDDLQRAQKSLRQRVELLEKRGCSTVSTGLGGIDKKLSLVALEHKAR